MLLQKILLATLLAVAVGGTSPADVVLAEGAFGAWSRHLSSMCLA